MSSKSSKYRRACKECRSRHLKCDLAKPCKSCSQAGRPCTEFSSFTHDQSEQDDQLEARFNIDLPESDLPVEQGTANTGYTTIECLTGNSSRGIRYHSPCQGDVISLPGQASFSNSTSQEVLTIAESPFTSPQSKNTGLLVQENVIWPLLAKDEAFLMRYFVTELSTWFDYCDKQRHFSTIVVQAAATSPTLNNAILAVAAKHLSMTRGFDRFTPDRYQRECLMTLIPALANPDAVLDESLFAATVILRLFDEMTERLDEPDTATHIFGSHMLINARERARSHSTPISSSLRSATLLIELRQDIRIAFMANRSPPPLVEYCDVDRTLDPTDDWTWAHRMVAHTADVLTYCNSDGNKSLERWRELRGYLDAWKAALPPSFTPIYKEDADPKNGRLFPIIWLANDCHTAGLEYLALSTIVLLAHDPQIPLLGPSRITKLQETDSQIKAQVRLLCGIALSNERFFTTKLVAGFAIAMCGERFTERKEQEAFMQILEVTEAHVAWPYLRGQERLKKCWSRKPG